MGTMSGAATRAVTLIVLLVAAAAFSDNLYDEEEEYRSEVFPDVDQDLYSDTEMLQETAQVAARAGSQEQQKEWGAGLQDELAEVAKRFGGPAAKPDPSILKLEKSLTTPSASASPMPMDLGTVSESISSEEAAPVKKKESKLPALVKPEPSDIQPPQAQALVMTDAAMRSKKLSLLPQNLADAWRLITQQHEEIQRLKREKNGPVASGSPIQLLGAGAKHATAVLDICHLPKTINLKGAEHDPRAKAAETNIRFALREAREQIQCDKKNKKTPAQKKALLKAKKQHAQQKNMLKNIFGMLAKAEGSMGSMRPTVLDAKKMHNKMKKESQAQASHMAAEVSEATAAEEASVAEEAEEP